MDPDEPAAVINPERIVFMRDLVRGAKKFVEEYYIPDVLAIAPFYKDWFTRGEGVGNFLCKGSRNWLAAIRGSRVLIGGLGFGFTLKSALSALASDATVVMVELLAAVVAWNRNPSFNLAA